MVTILMTGYIKDVGLDEQRIKVLCKPFSDRQFLEVHGQVHHVPEEC